MTDQQVLDRDLAIILVTAPVSIGWFVVTLVRAVVSDWRREREEI